MPPSADPPSAPDAPPSSSPREAMLIDFLAEHDMPCPLCRYNLRNLRSSRCPECGRELRLSVGLVEPLLGPYLALVTATCLPAGPGLFFWFTIISHGFPGMTGEDWCLGLVLLYLLLAVPLALVVLAARRRLLKLKPSAQYALAGMAVAVDAVMLLTLLAQLFG